MLEIKVSEATPRQLDWMVAKCEGATDEWHTDKPFFWDGVPCVREAGHDVGYTPSTNWAKGGPIIERERVHVYPIDANTWEADTLDYTQFGSTPLVAAMRCYVASKMGDEVEIPEELTNVRN